MSTYGRNFEFRVPPRSGERAGRYSVPTTGTRLAIGAPIATDVAAGLDTGGRQKVALVTGATAPRTGFHGILVYEYGDGWAYNGLDPNLSVYSDMDTAPLGAAVQMVFGSTVKVVLRNTADSTFLNSNAYEGQTMVAGIGTDGATPTTLEVGDYLTPGTGNFTDGFWAEGTEADGWLIVTKVDAARGEVEARMTF